jgi:hypothetical protein
MTSAEEFQDLVGFELSAICFVRDYVELHFDGPILRSLAAPAVVLRGRRIEYPETGSRDALCGLIGRTVERAADEGGRLALQFPRDMMVEIPKASRGHVP